MNGIVAQAAVGTSANPTAPDEVPALLGEVLEALPVAVIVTDTQRNVVLVNGEAESLLGYPRDALLGRPVDVLVPDDVRQTHIANQKAYLDAPVSRRMGVNRDLMARRADGSLVPVEIALKPIASARGPLVIEAIVDLSARKALEQHVREANVELERLVRERTAALERSDREKTAMLERLEQARAELEKLSRKDPLTGLANRREFAERVELEQRRAERHRGPMCLAMLDLDRFKQVNDRYGHALGDDVLRRVATILLEQSRATDVVARYGGEEFAFALPDTNLDEAQALCERIRCRVAAFPWHAVSDGLRVTLSIGVVQRQPGESVEVALGRADDALYQAKRQGRDRVETGVAPRVDTHRGSD